MAPHQYDPQEIKYMLDAYRTSGGSLTLAVRQLVSIMSPPPSARTVKKYWELEGYRTNPHGGKKTAKGVDGRVIDEAEKDLIVKRLRMHHGNISAVARAMDHDRTTVRRVLIEKGAIKDDQDLEGIVQTS